MGRGAGNCASEQLLGFLKNAKYDIIPLLKFLEKHIVPLKESGVVWGYNIPYLLTGQINRHTRSAIAATKEKRTDFLNFYLELWKCVDIFQSADCLGCNRNVAWFYH